MRPKTFSTPSPRRLVFLVLALSCALVAFGCGGSGGSKMDTVSVQLDWTPNTNHVGIYVAQAKGWYKEAGVNLKILPYTDVNPDVIVANGKADVGVSFPASVIFSRAAGLDIVSIASVLQSDVTQIAVLDSSDLKRPRDLDGKVYAGFGAPFEVPQLTTVIKADGGQGKFTSATLATAAYDALYNKRADFTEIFTAWEGIQADMKGIKLRTFKYEDYGVPDRPSVVLVAKSSTIAKRAEVLQRFVTATQRGYELAAKQPDDASKTFLDSQAKGTFPEPDLVNRSDRMLAPVLLAPNGHWGPQDASKWDAFTKWMLGQNVVVDEKQKVVTTLAGGPLYTNQFFSGSAQASP